MATRIPKGHVRWTVYEAKDGFRWRKVAANNEIVGASSEAYTRRTACVYNAVEFNNGPNGLYKADVVDVREPE